MYCTARYITVLDTVGSKQGFSRLLYCTSYNEAADPAALQRRWYLEKAMLQLHGIKYCYVGPTVRYSIYALHEFRAGWCLRKEPDTRLAVARIKLDIKGFSHKICTKTHFKWKIWVAFWFASDKYNKPSDFKSFYRYLIPPYMYPVHCLTRKHWKQDAFNCPSMNQVFKLVMILNTKVFQTSILNTECHRFESHRVTVTCADFASQ